MSNIERNASSAHNTASDPHLSVLYRLADALEVPPLYLLPDAQSKVVPRSPEQASNAAVSRVETELTALIELWGRR